ncbi:hypothetical protein AGABI1DRAFT_111875 [Agaricus bisporus var. burnettii JB137-S8]|uniref:Thioredoxin domain-containing protein n=1 Tax=Agaricus bisporus var. burnettii (strain JB137-S8 / ATCC MYA-4627 / FGSC 10392) TaxID=597362 RepID=K5Y1C9_AGABU|nr:uncharacterized protein AGABI1DRAFT_111875 [Agaricus bisporus var. burnettii JB137-S8]EKM81590.1 hypothetical protein AGABI1DRAFT_111875 [Agaricus bisporus var. burnettii JB137-S8]
MFPRLVLLCFALQSSLLLTNAFFTDDSLVKMLTPESFKGALEPNATSMIAFVSSSNSDCQNMAPEYEKAALGLYPFVPSYAVNCDDEGNKDMCREQNVETFPTTKLFPRGNTEPPVVFEGSSDRSASSYFYWASRRIPSHVTKLYRVEEIQPWAEKTKEDAVVLLLTKEKKVPMLWKVLANQYLGRLELASHRDRRGKSSVALGMEKGEKKDAKVLVYPAGSTEYVRYEGIMKMDSLSNFFEAILDGSVDLKTANDKANAEEFTPDEKELEIERKQEAQRIALAHGGLTDFIDFEKAIKAGHGADYHDIHGYPGMMGETPKKKKSEDDDMEGEEFSPSNDDSMTEENTHRISDEL